MFKTFVGFRYPNRNQFPKKKNFFKNFKSKCLKKNVKDSMK